MSTKTEITDQSITEAGHDIDTAAQVRALCAHLDCQPEGIALTPWAHYGLSNYAGCGGEYAIGTDAEADSAVAEYIKDSVWAFKASFIASFTDLPEEMFSGMQDKCEGANDAFLKCVERAEGGLDAFIAEAVSADGRGHFLSGYDGEESEEGEFFIYRTN